DGLTEFFDSALRRGDATCVIGTEEIREGVTRRLRTAGWDIGGSSPHPRFRLMNAEGASIFMRNGLPDAALVEEVVSELDRYRRDAGEGSSPRLTIFGNTCPP